MKIASDQDQFNVAIYGAGNIASEFDYGMPASTPPLTHAKAFCEHPGFNTIAILDVDHSKALRAGHRWNIPFIAKSFDELANIHSKIHVVSICTPPESHLDTIRCIISKLPNLKLVFCEKPLCDRYENIDGFDANIPIIVNYSRRWDIEINNLKKSCFLNNTRFINAYYSKGLFTNGSHLIDLFYYLFHDLKLTQKTLVRDAPDPLVQFGIETACGKTINVMPIDNVDYSVFEIEFFAINEYRRMLDGGRAWMIRKSGTDPVFEGYQSLKSPCVVPGGYSDTLKHAVSEIFEYLTKPYPDLPRSSVVSAIQTHKTCQKLVN